MYLYQTQACHPLRQLQKILVALLLTALAACGGSGDGDSQANENGGQSGNSGGSGFDEKALLLNSAKIMQGGYAKLGQSMPTLTGGINDYCSALGGVEEQAKRDVAQVAFKEAMNDLQHSLLHGIGPALDEDRMLQLYSWPLTSPCQIDLKLASNQPELNNAVNKRGMDTLEYLLFIEPAANHSCPSDVTPVPADLLDNFNALNAADKQARRCAFMINVAADAANSAVVLADAWDAEKGNYAAGLIGTENTKEALNQVTDAMFYFEEVVKENKLDAPLGGGITNTTPSCGAGQPCSQDVESPHARTSKENLIANMLAFQTLYHGGDVGDSAAKGFDDWLEAEGKATLAKDFGGDVQAVITGLKGINGTLFDAVSNNIEPLNALVLGPLQDVSKSLRFNLMPALGLRLPAGSESDTD